MWIKLHDITESTKFNCVYVSGNSRIQWEFLTLPVTFLEYFAAVFVVCYVTWLIIKSAGGKFYLIIIAMMCLLVVNIQEMNDVF